MVGLGTEKTGCGLYADEGVVFGVLVRIDRIIKEGPGDACEIDQDGRRAQRSGCGRPCKQRAPVESEAKEDLWPPCKAFGERIDADKRERADAKRDGERCERQENPKGDEALNDHPDHGPAHGDLA